MTAQHAGQRLQPLLTAQAPCRCEMGGPRPDRGLSPTRRIRAGCVHEHEAVGDFCSVCAAIVSTRENACDRCRTEGHACTLRIVSDIPIVSDTTRTVSDT